MQFIPALNQGGAEKSTLEIASALIANGHRASVVSAGGRMLVELNAIGANHFLIDLQKKSLKTLLQRNRLVQLIEQERPDIIHLRSRLPAWMVHWALKKSNFLPRIVSTVHGLNSPSWYSRIMTRADQIICVSNSTRAHIEKHYPELDRTKISVIARGIDHQFFRRGYLPSSVWNAAFVGEFPQLAGKALFVLPARGTRLKGHDLALQALAAVRSHNHNAALILLGAREPGREKYVAGLELLAANLGLSAHLAITPARRDVRDIYVTAKAVLQTSRQPEAFGRTVIEALALGTPVLGFDHGGVGEILHQYFPFGLVENHQVDALAKKMLQTIEQAPTVEKFSAFALQTMQEATLDVYQSVLTSAQRKSTL